MVLLFYGGLRMVWSTYVAVCALVLGGNPVIKSSFEGRGCVKCHP